MGMGALALIGTAVSTGVAIYGQQQQQQAVEQAAEYNNDLAEKEALNKEAETREATRRQRINNRADLAAMRVGMTGQGRQLTTGTPLLLLGDAAGALDLGIADATRAATMQAASLRAQGKMGLWEADQAGQASKLAMIGTGVSGLTRAYGQYQEGSELGMYPRIGESN
jgi:hypothetical protein